MQISVLKFFFFFIVDNRAGEINHNNVGEKTLSRKLERKGGASLEWLGKLGL